MKKAINLNFLLTVFLSITACKSDSEKSPSFSYSDKKEEIEPQAGEQSLPQRKYSVSEPVFMDFRLGMTGAEFDSLLEYYANLGLLNKKIANNQIYYIYPFGIDDVIIPMAIRYACENKSNVDCKDDYIKFITLSIDDETYNTQTHFNNIKKSLQEKYGNFCYRNYWKGKEVSHFFREDIEWITKQKHISLNFMGSIDENDNKKSSIAIKFEHVRSCDQKGSMLESIVNGMHESLEADYLKKKYGKPTTSDIERTKRDF